MVASMCVKICEHTPGDGVLVGSENDSNTSCVVYNLLWEPRTFGGVQSVGTVFCHTFLRRSHRPHAQAYTHTLALGL